MEDLNRKMAQMKKRWNNFIQSVPDPENLSEEDILYWKAKLSAVSEEMDYFLKKFSREFKKRHNS